MKHPKVLRPEHTQTQKKSVMMLLGPKHTQTQKRKLAS